MIEIALWNGEFYYPNYKQVESLTQILQTLQDQQKLLYSVRKEKLLNLFQNFSELLLKDPSVNTIPGLAFIVSWLRKGNFQQLVDRNFKSMDYLEKFIGEKKQIKAQPRGIACHWIAGNVPTIGIFSLFQSLFVGNINILRIPKKSHDIILRILRVFGNSKTEDGINGNDILKSIGVIFFEKTDTIANTDLSMLADVRIVWGGEEAVQAISNLPKRSHCEDIVFGPKYSFAVFDKTMIQSEDFAKNIRFLASDTILFDQSACTSPHTIFFEKSEKSIHDIGMELASEFKRISKKNPKLDVSQYIMTKIINIRAEYALDLKKELICSAENDWTILINPIIQLEEPIESRTIFIKEIESISDTLPLITKKIQTIGCAVKDKAKLLSFADNATLQGVARCVNVGQMHLFDSPWDGTLFMSRLVNWATLYYD